MLESRPVGRTLFVHSMLSATKYSKVRATAEREGRHFRWGLWNTGISFRLPSLRLLLSMFSWKCWRKFGQKSFHISSMDWTLISSFPSPPHPICTPPINSYHLVMLPNSLFYMWFLQSRCGLLFTIINPNHNQKLKHFEARLNFAH